MIDFLIFFTFIASVFMGISIGASAVPPAFGPVTFSRNIGVLKSALLAGIAACLGAVVQGGNVASTVGSKMIFGDIQPLQALSILIVAPVLVIISVLTKYPMPTAFTVVGSVIGSAFSFGVSVEWVTIQKIVGYWALVPILAVIIAYSIARLLKKYVSKEGSKKSIHYATLLLGLFVAYTAGANSVGKAVGPLMGMGFELFWLLPLGGFSILIGAWVLSPKIIEAVTFEYSNLGPRRSVSALATAAILAQIGVFIGVPISFGQAIIASIIGSGMVISGWSVGKRKIVLTSGAWISAIFVAIGLTYTLGNIFQYVVG
ncbi:MAG: inorganic phosphate transporter [Thermoplasmata archaeon]